MLTNCKLPLLKSHLSYLSNSGRFIVGIYDRRTVLYDVQNQTEIRKFNLKNIWDVTFSPNDTYCCLRNTKHTIELYSTNDWNLLMKYELKCKDQFVSKNFHFTDNEKGILTAHRGEIIFIDIENNKTIINSDYKGCYIDSFYYTINSNYFVVSVSMGGQDTYKGYKNFFIRINIKENDLIIEEIFPNIQLEISKSLYYDGTFYIIEQKGSIEKALMTYDEHFNFIKEFHCLDEALKGLGILIFQLLITKDKQYLIVNIKNQVYIIDLFKDKIVYKFVQKIKKISINVQNALLITEEVIDQNSNIYYKNYFLTIKELINDHLDIGDDKDKNIKEDYLEILRNNGLSKEILLNIDEESLTEILYNYTFDLVNQYNISSFEACLELIPEGFKLFYYTVDFEEEIENDGLESYLLDYSSDEIRELLKCLEIIQSQEIKEIVAECLKLKIQDKEKFNKEVLKELEYKLVNTNESLEKLRINFFKNNLSLFLIKK